MSDSASEFLLTKETDRYKRYSRHFNSEYGDKDLYESQDIFVFSDLVLYRHSAKRKKVYRSGKIGVYFEVLNEMTYSARRYNREGEPMFRVFNDYGDHTRTESFSPNNEVQAEVARYVVEMVERNYGFAVDPEWLKSSRFYQLIAYPLFREWSLPQLAAGSELHKSYHSSYDNEKSAVGFSLLSRGFLRSSLRAMVIQTFGRRFLRKDFIKTVATTESIIRLATLAKYKKHFTTDLAQTFLRAQGKMALEVILTSGSQKDVLTYMLAPLTPAQRKRVLLSTTPDRHYLVTDSLRIVQYLMRDGIYEHDRVDFRNWETIHDTLAYIHRDQNAAMEETRIRRDELKTIEQKRHYKILDETVMEFNGSTYSIRSAKNLNELRVWGAEMHNCIGSYGEDALSHKSYLFGVYEGEKLLANMELTPKGEVVQLYGKHNRELAGDVTAAITEHVGSLTASPK